MDSQDQNSSLLTKIYREVGEVQTGLRSVGDKLDLHISSTVKELKAINELDNEQNRILDLHIAGVNTLKEMHVQHRAEASEQIRTLKEILENQHKEMDARLDALERPYDLLKLMGKVFVWSGGIIGTIYTLLKLLKILG